MSACQFTIPFNKPADAVLKKISDTILNQGGRFEGDISAGSFYLEVFGQAVGGSYQSQGQTLEILITEKPFLVPCAAIESFLQKQLND